MWPIAVQHSDAGVLKDHDQLIPPPGMPVVVAQHRRIPARRSEHAGIGQDPSLLGLSGGRQVTGQQHKVGGPSQRRQRRRLAEYHSPDHLPG